jgi:hypothetical protein
MCKQNVPGVAKGADEFRTPRTKLANNADQKQIKHDPPKGPPIGNSPQP